MPPILRPRQLLAVITGVVLLLPAVPVGATAPSVPPGPPRVLVRLEGGASAARTLDGIPGVGQVRTGVHTGVAVVEAAPGHGAAGLLRALARRPDVVWAEPDQVVTASDLGDLVDDPLVESQWGLDNTGQTIDGVTGTAGVDVGVAEAWAHTRGGSDVVVAVVDTGVDVGHPDLADRVWTNPEEVPGNGVDDDGNGYVDDVHGWDFVHGDATVFDPADGEDHGTHVAGTVAATADDGTGVAGVAPGVTVLPLKFLGPDGSGFLGDAVLAIEYATAVGADVLNASWGAPSPSLALEEALMGFDGVVLAAAGNAGADIDETPVYPAAYDLDHLLAVAAVRADGALPSWSNRGAETVDVGAPGEWILSTVPGGWASAHGTSMAAPHVAGVVALGRSLDPAASPVELADAVRATVQPLDALAATTSTGGMADAGALLAHLDGTPATSEPTTSSPSTSPSPEPTTSPSPDPTTSPSPEPTTPPAPEEEDAETTVTLPSRLAGEDRYATAVAITRAAFPGTVDDVYVATGTGFADALAGTAAAGRRGGAVLLTPADHLPDVVAAELDRLAPRRVWILGGSAAVSDEVEAALGSTGATVRRLAGPDRYATSAIVSARTFAPDVPVAYLATGRDFPDALAAGAAAGSLGGPLLLTDRDHLPATVADELARLGPRRLVVLGGPNAVAEPVLRAAGAAAGVTATRVGGATRYDTAAAIVADAFTHTTGAVLAATGTTFPDALSGGAAGARVGAPVLLLPPGQALPEAVADEVRRLAPDQVVALGGTAALPEATVAALRALLP